MSTSSRTITWTALASVAVIGAMFAFANDTNKHEGSQKNRVRATAAQHLANVRRDVGLARSRASGGNPSLPDVTKRLRLDQSTVKIVGEFETSDGSLTIVTGTRIDGAECMVGFTHRMTGVSCDDLFATGPIAYGELGTFSASGHAEADVIFGITQDSVKSIEVSDSAGTRSTVVVNSEHAFSFDVASATREGSFVTSLRALTSGGAEVGAESLPRPDTPTTVGAAP